MARFTVLFLCFIISATSEPLRYRKHGEVPQKPEFCHNLDCPSYTVLDKTDSYELRKYSASGWVATRTTNMEFMKAQYTNFMKLFDYIQGANVKKQKIAMTAPVLAKIIPGPGPACESDFTMFFFVSPTEENPPKPTDTSVFLTQNQTISVYVRSFKGYVREANTWLDEATKLAQDLQGKNYNKDYYFTAGYDSPFRLLDRHNEIWFLADN